MVDSQGYIIISPRNYRPFAPKAAMIMHKPKTKTLQNFPSEEETSSSTERTKMNLLPSQGSVNPLSSAPQDQ